MTIPPPKKNTKFIISGYHHKIGNITMGYVYNNLGYYSILYDEIRGCGMGTWLVLVSPCFREIVVATCKIGSSLCNLDNLLQKNIIVLFFGNQISKWRSKKGLFLTYFSYFLVTRESYKNSFSTYLTHIHTYTYFAHAIDLFCLTNF